jgi:RNA polymerase sigma factor (sigma-70 family)
MCAHAHAHNPTPEPRTFFTSVQPLALTSGFSIVMDEMKEIIAGCVKGEKRAQDRLYKKFSSLLYSICLRYTKNKMEAQDVLQDVFVKIYNNIHTYHHDGSFEGWLRRIAVNTSITNYRRNLKHAYQSDLDDLVKMKDEPVLAEDLEYTAEEMMLCIQNLPAGYKTVFNLYVIEGFMHKEISDMLGIDVNTSKSQLSRAKTYLQKELAAISKIKSIA